MKELGATLKKLKMKMELLKVMSLKLLRVA